MELNKMTVSPSELQQVAEAISGLVLFRKIFDDPILSLFKKTLQGCLDDDVASKKPFFAMINKLLNLKESFDFAGIDLFKNHLLNTMLAAENALSLACEKTDFKDLDALLVKVAQRDLFLLKKVYDLDLFRLEKYLALPEKRSHFLPPLGTLFTKHDLSLAYPASYFKKRADLKKTLINSSDWGKQTGALCSYYKAQGSGLFARYRAFKWHGPGGGGEYLQPVANPDPVRLDDLVGYEAQKKEVLRNTKQFVHRFGANNMLLYGDRGTGKSSTIKSLIHIFGDHGLRMIEVSKHDLLSLHQLVAPLEGRRQRFIIFIDDLSFEESETEYKELKALLEGSIVSPAENILIYATSNRRHLVKEFFSDRETDEVGKSDTYQEKLSLADRFGIKLVYTAPGKEEYLTMVDEMAKKAALKIDRKELHKKALHWALWHNGWSGRTARQFINDLTGKVLSDEEKTDET